MSDSKPLTRSTRLAAIVAAAAAFGALTSAEAGAVLTGVCPDGSMFIVQTLASVPCDRAKLVDPNDMPPLKPELLPRPYAWERFQREQDPNNPYNLIGSERPSHAARPEREPAITPAVQLAPTPPETLQAALQPPHQQAAQAAAPSAPRAGQPLELGLSRDDIENLFLIVELAQQRAPASFERPGQEGQGVLTLRIAYSQAFEPRLREFWARRGPATQGPVVLFSVVATAAEDFHANLTFVQGHVAFHPDPADPRQLGLVTGSFGPQRLGDSALGYVVLPEHMDPAQPIDIYWNDRLVTAQLF